MVTHSIIPSSNTFDPAQLMAVLATKTARLRTIVDNVPVLLAEVNCDGVYTVAEGDALRRMGKRPEDLVGHRVGEVFPDRPELVENHRRALSGAEFSTTISLGGKVWHTKYVPIRGSDGELTGFTCVSLDITERVRSEIELESGRRREAGIAELSRAALAGAALHDLMQAGVSLVAHELPDIDVVALGEVNRTGVWRLAITGAGLPDADRAQPVLLATSVRDYPAAGSLQTGEPLIVADWKNETRLPQPEWVRHLGARSSAFLPVVCRHEEQRYGFLGVHARQRRDFAEDEILFIETVANLLGDVIARRAAQDAAAQQAEQFRALAENSPNIVARFNRELRMVYVNGTVERLTGTPASELIGHTVREMSLTEPQVSAFELALRQVLRSGTQRVIDIDVATVLGRRQFQARMAPEFGPDGTAQSVVVATHDLTDQHRSDEAQLAIYRQLLAQQEELRELISASMASRQVEHAHDLQLNERERQILTLIARGRTNRQIAAELHISYGNAKNQVSRLLTRMGVADRTQAAARVAQLGLLEPAAGS